MNSRQTQLGRSAEKNKIKLRNICRTDIKALRSRYESVAMQEQYVIEANRTIEIIQYRNERAMLFGKFISKLVKAVDEL